MTDFFDWLTTSDTGLAADRLANAYNLSPSELRETTQALAPAFSLALTRAMSDPLTATNLSQQFAPFFGTVDPTSRKIADRSEVERLTESLFGSRTLIDAISRQVSSVTGTAPDTVDPLMRNLTLMSLQTMMQMIGASVMRGIGKGEFDRNEIPANVADLMRRSANAIEAFSRSPDAQARGQTSAPGMSNVFADAFKGPLPWLPPVPFMASTNAIKPKEEELAEAENGSGLPPMPFLAIVEGISKGLAFGSSQGNGRTEPEQEEREGAPATRAPDPAPFGRLVNAGAELQADYFKRMRELFDADLHEKRKSEES